jgi:hypothetical protein
VRFTKLLEKRGKIIAELDALLLEAHCEAERFIYTDMFIYTETTFAASAQEAHAKAIELLEFIERNRIYLQPTIYCEHRAKTHAGVPPVSAEVLNCASVIFPVGVTLLRKEAWSFFTRIVNSRAKLSSSSQTASRALPTPNEQACTRYRR